MCNRQRGQSESCIYRYSRLSSTSSCYTLSFSSFKSSTSAATTISALYCTDRVFEAVKKQLDTVLFGIWALRRPLGSGVTVTPTTRFDQTANAWAMLNYILVLSIYLAGLDRAHAHGILTIPPGSSSKQQQLLSDRRHFFCCRTRSIPHAAPNKPT